MSWTELDSILALYEAGPGPFCLATLVRVTGSSYRQPGARMLVNDSGQTAGSLSPGCIEEEVAGRGVAVIAAGASERLNFDLRSLFGCDGHILVVLERVAKPSAFFQHLLECRRRRKPLLTVMRGQRDAKNPDCSRCGYEHARQGPDRDLWSDDPAPV